MAEFQVGPVADRMLAGAPSDYLGGDILAGDLAELAEDVDALLALTLDDAALPTSEARGGLYGDRHLEYWLSGYRDALSALSALGLRAPTGAKILEFGAGAGRVCRHLPRESSGATVYACDANGEQAAWLADTLGHRLIAFQNAPTPSLPFADGTLDAVIAISVFTEFAHEDMGWLLEFRRVLKPAGCVYLTIVADASWRELPDGWDTRDLVAEPRMRARYDALAVSFDQPVILTRPHSQVVYRPQAHVVRNWGRIFPDVRFEADRLGDQTVVLLRR